MIKERLALGRPASSSRSPATTATCCSTSSRSACLSSASSRPPTSPKSRRKKGIPTLVEFFGVELGRSGSSPRARRADLIIGNNVLAQVPDLNDFVAGMAHLLKPEGVDHARVPASRAADGGEPVRHHLSRALLVLLADRRSSIWPRATASRLFDVEELPTHGGSLRVYLAALTPQHAADRRRVDSCCAPRAELGFDEIVDLRGASPRRCSSTKRKLLDVPDRRKNEGKTICGYGAPGKGNTLLNYCGIGTDFLDFTVDRNPYKHGRFTPGMHIPILPVEAHRRRPSPTIC